MLNAISVDVEEYFHATNLDPYVGRSRWNEMSTRAPESINATLEVFEKTGTLGTFFVLGDFARRNPQQVKRLAEAGHEIASHGFNHQLAYLLSPEDFYEDIRSAKQLLEDICGTEVTGYRAPNFSITEKNPWAYDKLVEAGYTYDSSVYPVWHPRYTNLDKPRVITVRPTNGGELLIVPLAASELSLLGKKLRLPVAGGAYWRLFPEFFIRWGLSRINARDHIPFCCYIHPWELDPGQPRFEEMPALTKLRHYGGIADFSSRVERYLRAFEFSTIQKLIEEWRSGQGSATEK